jgi:lysophospholipase L1-like esterase
MIRHLPALVFFALATSVAFTARAAEPAPLRIVLIGDSTVCDYPATRPDRGWGQFIAEKFEPGSVTVINLAAAGRSTKTFITEGRWTKALAEKPGYVFIQFGHNDSHSPEKPESTDAVTTYRDYLRRYIDEARAIHATPILVTPMVRRTFGPDGKLADNLAPYADAMKSVAAEKKTALIDLHTASLALVEKLGPARAQEFANKPTDFTHFNEKGARAMAGLIITDLPSADPKLARLLISP